MPRKQVAPKRTKYIVTLSVETARQKFTKKEIREMLMQDIGATTLLDGAKVRIRTVDFD